MSAPDGWAATYGGIGSNRASFVQQTSNGGYIVVGITESFDRDYDLLVLKLRPDGTVEWQKTYGGVGTERAHSIQQTSDGGYVVVSATDSFGAGETDFWVLKLRPDGTIEWQKTYGGVSFDWVRSIQQTIDGGYIVAGETLSFGAGSFDLWVLKLKPYGTVEWQKTYGGVNTDWAYSLRQTSDGGYVAAGGTNSFGTGNIDLWVLKLKPDGTVEWQKTYGGVGRDDAHSIQQTRDGGYIVAGSTESFIAGKDNLWVLKLKHNGAVEWQKTYWGAYVLGDETFAIQQTGDGEYVVAGKTESFGAGDADLWVLRLKSDGAIEWQKTYGGSSHDGAHSIQQTLDGGYIAAGWTDSFGAGGLDFWVLKLRPDGSFGHAQDKSIDTPCNFINDTSTSGINSNATVLDTSASVRDSNANPQDSSARIGVTDFSASFLCP
ncbi:MAG: hypothetical protein HY715_01845 [Planctomycetes bacterium]|nr:hypothetical protein [Planctomycetota bacterium]